MLASPSIGPEDFFWPPRCPNDECTQAAASRPRGFLRHGYYVTRVAPRRIPRFICRHCKRTVSSQTFDKTYRLRRPELEAAIVKEISLGASMRRVARVLGINRKTVSRRLIRARRDGVVFENSEVRTGGSRRSRSAE